ncbi:MAG: indole-3-glycerol phosphate synthase TrpC [Candidatus Saelkia tenebricola]|nr:indole-3-glycerol phosphate synthase TrpC [Candidatus Saelkia tenebricola]
MSILNNILEKKRAAIAKTKEKFSLSELKKALFEEGFGQSDFLKSLKEKEANIRIIAEIKKASPSEGDILDSDASIIEIARLYELNGAAAISVLTEKDFFKGETEDLVNIKKSTTLPVLRKDFIIDEYQIYESKYFKADAVLLIAKILSLEELDLLNDVACNLEMDVLFEIHDQDDLNKVLELTPQMIGVNNRNLSTLETDIEISTHLLPEIPEEIFKISESAIKNYKDILYLKSLGADAFLIGESILTSPDSAEKIRSLLGYGQD